MYLFDTDILVDYLRLHKPAREYLENMAEKERHIALITHFELLKGCNKKVQANRIGTFLKHFSVLPLEGAVSKKALNIYQEKKWHAHIDIPDAFIAATAISHKLTLVTRNLKHYKGIDGLKIKKPY